MVQLKHLALLPAAALLGTADAFWRAACRERSGLARLDPLVDTGMIGAHSHSIFGGNTFGFNTTNQELASSECTSCEIVQDKSAYWTPTLHFMHPDGTTDLVEQVGGMLVYYLLYPNGADYNIRAFPKGFGLLGGNPSRRNTTLPDVIPPESDWPAASSDPKLQDELQQKAIGFNCLNYAQTPEPTLFRHKFPEKSYMDEHCTDGIRLELMMPSCWNPAKGVNPSDHQSHMAYPNLVMTGDCPSDFPVKTPSILFESIWNTYAYKGKPGKFVISNGDEMGVSYHGDFMNGWPEDFLQQAVDTCTNPSGLVTDCPLFDLQSPAEAAKCKFNTPKELIGDDIAGPRQGLPGDVPVEKGPSPATLDTAIPLDAAKKVEQTAVPVANTVTQAVPTLAPRVVKHFPNPPLAAGPAKTGEQLPKPTVPALKHGLKKTNLKGGRKLKNSAKKVAKPIKATLANTHGSVPHAPRDASIQGLPRLNKAAQKAKLRKEAKKLREGATRVGAPVMAAVDEAKSQITAPVVPRAPAAKADRTVTLIQTAANHGFKEDVEVI